MRASTADFQIREGDTRPVLGVTFTDADGNPVALKSTATITLRMRKWGSTSLKISSSTLWTITSTSGGTAQRTWSTGETNSTGSYFFTATVVQSTGTRTHPNHVYGTVDVTPKLGA